MSGKLNSGVWRSGLNTPRTSSRPGVCKYVYCPVSCSSHFDRVDWAKWLVKVRKFCKSDKPAQTRKVNNENIAPILIEKENDNRPYISVNILDKSYTALLDSGASMSVLGADSNKFLEYFNLKPQSSNFTFISTADGSQKKLRAALIYLFVWRCVKLLKF